MITSIEAAQDLEAKKMIIIKLREYDIFSHAKRPN
jgi:hypothetical protein